MALYVVNEPPRAFSIGETWAGKIAATPGMGSPNPIEAPGDCIVCGAPMNLCTGDDHDAAAAQDNPAQAA